MTLPNNCSSSQRDPVHHAKGLCEHYWVHSCFIPAETNVKEGCGNTNSGIPFYRKTHIGIITNCIPINLPPTPTRIYRGLAAMIRWRFKLHQPLDIGRFGPLKKAYGREIEHLIRSISNGVSTTGKGILVSVTATTDACYSIKLYQWGGVAGMQR
ncbi:hypothetical protein DER45DRAFT_600010 [Fusarium avenaceum]|nr:hypothetical protein DER45DRAFT_600010 [Fusarium avenaceum]